MQLVTKKTMILFQFLCANQLLLNISGGKIWNPWYCHYFFTNCTPKKWASEAPCWEGDFCTFFFFFLRICKITEGILTTWKVLCVGNPFQGNKMQRNTCIWGFPEIFTEEADCSWRTWIPSEYNWNALLS